MYDTHLLGMLLIAYIALILLAMMAAGRKGRSMFGALLLSVFITPIIVIGIVLLLGPDYVVLARRSKKDQILDAQF